MALPIVGSVRQRLQGEIRGRKSVSHLSFRSTSVTTRIFLCNAFFFLCLLSPSTFGFGSVQAESIRSRIETFIASEQGNFNPKEASLYETHVEVGLYFEHLLKVNDGKHTFECDFYVTYRWKDYRNWTFLFESSEGFQTSMDTLETNEKSCQLDGNDLNLIDTTTTNNKYVEFGHNEMDLIYRPDTHFTNVHNNNYATHNELMRMFQDGTVELTKLVWGEFDFYGRYTAFPFDKQHFDIQVGSLSHSSERLILEPLESMTGLEESTMDVGSGWIYDYYKSSVDEIEPDYAHKKSNCRLETRSLFTFAVYVHREGLKYTDEVFIPVLGLIIVSWLTFAIDPHNMTARMELGMLTLLATAAWSSTFLSKFHTNEYPVWFDLFFFGAIVFQITVIFLAMMSSHIAKNISTRMALCFDSLCVVLVPFVDTLVYALLFGLEKDSSNTISSLRGVILSTTLLVPVTFAHFLWMYPRVKKTLTSSPTCAYKDTKSPDLDTNEIRLIFNHLDTDGDKMLTLEELFRGFKSGVPSTSMTTEETQMTQFVDILQSQFANFADPPYSDVVFTEKRFSEHHQEIFDHLLTSLALEAE